jgi:hypothetical protein
VGQIRNVDPPVGRRVHFDARIGDVDHDVRVRAGVNRRDRLGGEMAMPGERAARPDVGMPAGADRIGGHSGDHHLDGNQ